MCVIKEARVEDVILYVEHSERLFNSNGKDGFIFSPREAGNYHVSEKDVESIVGRWHKKTDEVEYEKAWLLWKKDKVVGHTVLRSGNLSSAFHRLDLELGIEDGFRKKGMGKELIKLAIQWTVDFTSVEWIDLMVLGDNAPAFNLYKSLGFVEVGRIEDSFRLCNRSVDNVYMVLEINR